MDEEFAHGGGEGELVGFSVGAQVEVEGFDDGVKAGSHEGGHVEGFGARNGEAAPSGSHLLPFRRNF